MAGVLIAIGFAAADEEGEVIFHDPDCDIYMHFISYRVQHDLGAATNLRGAGGRHRDGKLNLIWGGIATRTA